MDEITYKKVKAAADGIALALYGKPLKDLDTEKEAFCLTIVFVAWLKDFKELNVP